MSISIEALGPAEWPNVKQQDQVSQCEEMLPAVWRKDHSICLEISWHPELFPIPVAIYTTCIRIGKRALYTIELQVCCPDNFLI